MLWFIIHTAVNEMAVLSHTFTMVGKIYQHCISVSQPVYYLIPKVIGKYNRVVIRIAYLFKSV